MAFSDGAKPLLQRVKISVTCSIGDSRLGCSRLPPHSAAHTLESLMRRAILIFSAAACLLTGGCDRGGETPATDAAANDGGEVETAGAGTPESAAAPLASLVMAAKGESNKCPIMADLGWRAAVATTIDGDRILALIGKIRVSTGGYQVKLVPGPLDRMKPPNQHFTLEVVEPSGIVTQIVTEHPVHATTAAQPAYSALIVTCRGQEIERITDILELPNVSPDPVRP